VERDLEKRFIYFFTARPRVRFDLSRPPRYSLFGKELLVTFLVGGESKRVKRSIPVFWHEGVSFRPNFELLSDSFIRFFTDEMTTPIMSVHDFLKLQRIDIGFATEVHYVGITTDPGGRPLDRQHRGICDTIYRNPASHHDFFIEVSLFNPISDATSSDGGFRMIFANSMTNEIPVDDEGKVIEAGFISYFDTKSQEVDRDRALGFLRNRLAEMARQRKIDRIAFHLEAESPTEYDMLYSRKIQPSFSHTFLWELDGIEIKLMRFASEEELLAYTSRARAA
jgi:hypothetical protein